MIDDLPRESTVGLLGKALNERFLLDRLIDAVEVVGRM